jgi:hypothetical protein
MGLRKRCHMTTFEFKLRDPCRFTLSRHLPRCAFRFRCICAQAVPALRVNPHSWSCCESFGITCLMLGATNRRLVVTEEVPHILSAWFRCVCQGYHNNRGATTSPLHALETLGAQAECPEGRSLKRNFFVHAPLLL